MRNIKLKADAIFRTSVKSNKIDGVSNSPQQTSQVKKLKSNVIKKLFYRILYDIVLDNISELMTKLFEQYL